MRARSTKILLTIVFIFLFGTLARDFVLFGWSLVLAVRIGLALVSGSGAVALLAGWGCPILWERLAFLHGSNFVRGEEATTWSAGASHGVVVTRLVQIRLPAFGRKTQLFLELLSRDASFEDAVKLLSVDIQRRLFCAAGNNLFLLWLYLMLRRWHRRRHRLTRHVMIHGRLRHLSMWAAQVLAHPPLRVVHLTTLLHINTRCHGRDLAYHRC